MGASLRLLVVLAYIFLSLVSLRGEEDAFGGQYSHIADQMRVMGHDEARPPVILIPGMISSRLIAWRKKNCIGLNIEVTDIVWLNLKKMIETMTYDKHCWINCLKLGFNGTDPHDCKVRSHC